MRMELDKSLRKKTAKYGSLLKAYRTVGGFGLGAVAGGIILIVCGILIGLTFGIAFKVDAGIVFFLVFAVPGLIIAPLGYVFHKKRVNNYLEFYRKETGYSEAELYEADRELMGSDVVVIGGKSDNRGKLAAYMITEHYFLSIQPVKGCYISKLDDIVAAFCSDEIPGIGGYRLNLFIITRQDTKMPGIKNEYTGKFYRGFENVVMSNTRYTQEISMEVIAELVKRAPHIITCQKIAVNGVPYNLLSMDYWQDDWNKILEE